VFGVNRWDHVCVGEITERTGAWELVQSDPYQAYNLPKLFFFLIPRNPFV
jgi:hypothetical protein